MHKHMLGLHILVVGSAILASTTRAGTINLVVGGTPYTVTTVEGSFNAHEPLLKSQPWWGDQELASNVVTELKGGLGFPHVGSGSFSPFLGVEISGNTNLIRTLAWRQSDDSLLGLSIGRTNTVFISGSLQSPYQWLIVIEPGRLRSVTAHAGQVSLRWESVSNEVYGVETSTNLTAWSPLAANITADGTYTTFTTNTPGAVSFYRVNSPSIP